MNLYYELVVGVLLIILTFIIIYFWYKWKTSQLLKKQNRIIKEEFLRAKTKLGLEKLVSHKKVKDLETLTCRNCKQKYVDYYSHRGGNNENYVFKWEEGYCSPCTHKLFYPETISKCKFCRVTIIVENNKESPEICQDCYEERENQEKIKTRIKQKN